MQHQMSWINQNSADSLNSSSEYFQAAKYLMIDDF